MKLESNLWQMTPAEIVERAEATLAMIPWESRAAEKEDDARFREIWSTVGKSNGRRKKKRP